MHQLLALAEASSSHDPSSIVGIVVGSLSILASIAYVVRMLTRMESKLDSHNETAKEHKIRIDTHEQRLNAHDVVLAKMRVMGGSTSSGRHLAAVKITEDE
jgi:hypothetical protein